MNTGVLNGWRCVGKAVRTSKIDGIRRDNDFKLSDRNALIGNVLGIRAEF